MSAESALTKNAYCKSRPQCTLKGECCMTCEYGNLVTVSFRVAYTLIESQPTKTGGQ